MDKPETIKVVAPVTVNKDASGKMTFIITKEVIDRDRDLVKVDGLDLKNFKLNPVMLWSHNRDVPALGTWKSIRKTKIDGIPAITMQPEFAKTERHELAKIVEDLVSEGIIKAVSISFRPDWNTVEYVEPKGKNKGYNIINNGEVHEASIVNIGANQTALAKALGDKEIDKEALAFIMKDTLVEEEVDKDLTIVELQSKVAELELLVKEQELEEETEDSIYSAIFDEFEMSAPNTVADDNQIDPEDVSLSDLLD